MAKCCFFIVLIIFLVPVAGGAAPVSLPAAPEYSLDVAFDIARSKISGTAMIKAPADRELVIHTGNLKITEVRSGQHKIDADIHGGILSLHAPSGSSLFIRFEGIFRGVPGAVADTIDSRGISLTGLWYPQLDGLGIYHVRATLPEGFKAISEAEEINKSVISGKAVFAFEFQHPVGGVSLVASREYEETRDTVNGIGIYAYFFRQDRSLAGTYIEYAKKYIRLYEDMLGKYPYKRFSIVENFLPTGYSMPTYTLLGREVVRLPFIVDTSLGHEILHQWFGNLVYIDYREGNWAEGLTSYMADHLYEEQKGKGWEYRKQMLIDYESYANLGNEFPLTDFIGRNDFASKAIGYGKAAMVFHMARRTMGDAVFNRCLRDFVREKRFQKASWDDIRHIFEKNTGKDWGWFFRQWVDDPGIPALSVDSASVKQKGPEYEAAFIVTQGPKVYVMELPLTVYYVDGGNEHFTVSVEKAQTQVKLSLKGMPGKIVIDENYDLARRLSAKELPAVVAGMIGAQKPVIVLPPGQKDIYNTVLETFKGKGAVEKLSSEAGESDMKPRALIILGNSNPVAERLFGELKSEAGFSVTVRHNPWTDRGVVGIIDGKSREEVDDSFQKIFHYGKYSELRFDRGRNVVKSTESTERGMTVGNEYQPVTVAASAAAPVADIIRNISGKRIVYVGEYHDRFSNHAMELEIIKALHRKNSKMAIGMEMFQRPFQGILDKYIAGAIDEKAMLKGTEYFKRWGFDYNLYRPVLAFAREEKIPVIALNIESEIVDQVSKAGIESLSAGDRKKIPAQMDFSDEDYRERLHDIFLKHDAAERHDFKFFYQSQILWDESMSQSIDDFLKNDPAFQKDGQLIVLAGGGHLAYGSGIPGRTFRRNGLDYSIVLNDFDMDKGIADYIIYPEKVEGDVSPKIMVMLTEARGEVTVAGFPEGSISERAGLRQGDIIVSIDDTPVSVIDDIRICLLYKKKGDPVKLKILRKGSLPGTEEKEFVFTL